jgi:hypothetical protein
VTAEETAACIIKATCHRASSTAADCRLDRGCEILPGAAETWGYMLMTSKRTKPLAAVRPVGSNSTIGVGYLRNTVRIWYKKCVLHKKNKEMEIVMYWEARITRNLRTYKMLG